MHTLDQIKLKYCGPTVACNSPHHQSIVSIHFPESGKIRARKIVTRSRSRPTGKYPSWKMKRMIQWESHNELNAFRILDVDPNVKYFFEQPLEIRYRQEGGEYSHYPDLLVVSYSGKELWEIKPNSDAAKPENMKRTELMINALPEFGFTYRMVTGEELSNNPLMKNGAMLLKFGRDDIPALDRERLRVFLKTQIPLRWGDVIEGALGPKGRNHVCRLILEGSLVFDTKKAISLDTQFFKSNVTYPPSLEVGA
ncbi:TnsA endonuclease N-terminal domain-containing protein [Undibacterium sp. Di27W]|uniref:TnsA endonuclease N-terminal domain-containing protein n=1 Tax=Undibacterium sp. Di27W TaxID=3413036 RepID=UPI003BF2AA65